MGGYHPKQEMNDKKKPPEVALAVPDYQNDSAIGESAGWVSVVPAILSE